MPPNPEEPNALADIRTDAENGDADAQNSLGRMYFLGREVARDDVEAFKWYLLAGAQGINSATERIWLIEDNLTAAQQAEGQRLAREWKPKIQRMAQ